MYELQPMRNDTLHSLESKYHSSKVMAASCSEQVQKIHHRPISYFLCLFPKEVGFCFCFTLVSIATCCQHKFTVSAAQFAYHFIEAIWNQGLWGDIF